MTTDAFPTRFRHRLGDGRVQCDVCPRECKLHDGQRGLCYVRARRGDEIVLTTYGRSSGIWVDPIEKKPLYHFLPGSTVLSFGTAGCNLACRFCQNWAISKARTDDVLAAEATPDELTAAARRLGCRSIAFTYNDPVTFLEYAVDVARACRPEGIAAVAVTAGYVNPEAAREMFSVMDAANVDLKAFDDEFYRHVCGGALRPVLDTLECLIEETDVWVEITTLLIPGLNDSDAEIDAMTRWIVGHLGPDTPHHFTAFHPAFRMLDRPPTPLDTLVRARRIALDNGIRHVYVGNVSYPEGETTWCRCGRALIVRDGFDVASVDLTPAGSCPACGFPCPGVFDGSGGGRSGERRRGRKA